MNNNYENRIRYLIKYHDYLLKKNDNVIGIGLGNKIINNNYTDIPTLTFVVNKKLGASSLLQRDIIPNFIYGAVTDVIEGGEYKFYNSRVRPTCGGISIGSEREDAAENRYGTLCYPVVDRETKKKIFILSTAHILTADFRASIKSEIVQPALVFDKDNIKNNIGKISKIVPIDTSREDAKMNEVDAGIAIVGRYFENTFKYFIEPKLIDGTVIKKITKVKKGDKIWKIGAKTGKTLGKIIIENFKTEMSFSKEKLYFKNQLVADCSCDLGDSGALGVTTTGFILKEHKAFGMLMGGIGEFAIFNPIDRVLDLLNVDLLVFEK